MSKLIGKTRSGRKLHKWRDLWAGSGREGRSVSAYACGLTTKFKDVTVTPMPTTADTLCRLCFHFEHHQVLTARYWARQGESKQPCPTCPDLAHPEHYCLNCGGTGIVRTENKAKSQQG